MKRNYLIAVMRKTTPRMRRGTPNFYKKLVRGYSIRMSEADKKIVTKEQLIERLQELAGSTEGWSEQNHKGESPESAHVKADRALLEYIGDEEVTKVFDSVDKWYA
ncbi:MAG: hypothetical protein HYW65_00690 [Candidatus Liptonbacteria bacterium]|nr:hypothetical protein [Candidatus Liptonbacteria bacterium]